MGNNQPATVDGRSTRWDDHRAARRAELVHAARKVVHKNGPAVSMDEIATASGTSKSIIYRYFDDKVGLQVAVGNSVGEAMHDALATAAAAAGTPERALRAMVRVYLEMVEQSPNVYHFVMRTGVVAGTDVEGRPAKAPLDAFLESVTELVAQPFAQAAHVSEGTAAVWAAGAVGFVRGTGEWWLHHRDEPGTPSREELTEQVADWLWFGPVGLFSPTRGDDASTHHHPSTPGEH
ncbi:TetR/AcrR family transcriptional regulator [Paraoerskovia marina]|uniref:DNA-binding transcriptional regulator, AcrR family n=2 Tax=Paraoerskovia marina TaxID=545619 RepID=A0A1H1W866_9CELL|nr:TetR/AcrR family transcriptional regulator [Paraoerskovia marina]SDS92646.1 DNA-binding transcriptional regulator, AcrR family [Paraoerskovia marina]